MSSALEVALFIDATETLFRIADQLHSQGYGIPVPPLRHGVANADEIRDRILSGRNPMAAMSLDDAIGIRYGADPRGHDLTVIAGVHRDFLELMAAPGVHHVDELRGRRIGIDTETGYARALMELLRRASLTRGTDFSVVQAGATNRRFERLIAGDIDAALLGSPFSDLAKERGFGALGSVPQLLGGYQGVVLVARAPWLHENRDQARAVVNCLLGAARWALDPAHAGLLPPMLEGCLPVALSQETRQRIAASLFGTKSQYLVDGRIHPGDIQVVIDLYNHDQGADLAVRDVCGWISEDFLSVDES